MAIQSIVNLAVTILPLDVAIGTLFKVLFIYFFVLGVLLSALKTKRRPGNLQETIEKEISYILIICDI